MLLIADGPSRRRRRATRRCGFADDPDRLLLAYAPSPARSPRRRHRSHNTNVNGCPGSDTGSDDNYGIAVLIQGSNSIIDGKTDAGFGTPIVVGGDFNAEPKAEALDHLYDRQIFGGGAAGRFKEIDQFFGDGPACRCGENTWHSEADPTVHRKLDYIFVSAGKWNDVGGGPTHSPYSDHDPYLGHATLETG